MTASGDARFAGVVSTAASGKQVRVLVRREPANRLSVRVLTLGPGFGATVGSTGPRRAVLTGICASCKRLRGLSALAPALPNLQWSGHRAAVTP
jgi:hypothetical protein